VSSVLLFVIALLGPWAVHLAPPRRRLLALVVLIGALLLFGIFASNPLTSWVFWVGLLVGIVSILGLAAFGGGGGSSRRRRRPRRMDDASEATGEL